MALVLRFAGRGRIGPARFASGFYRLLLQSKSGQRILEVIRQ
ncbi:MAG: hypothetical protein R2787_05310 [Saprospiraceae bacterium]